MSFEFRRLDETHDADWVHVIKRVYNRASAKDELPRDENESRFAITVNSEPVSACSVYDYSIARQCSTLKMGGVAAVGTVPEFRRSGSGSALMKGVISAMAEDGYDLSMLYAYRESYYERFDYGLAGWRYQIKCPQSRIPAMSSNLPVRQVEIRDLSRLNPVYEGFIRQMSGSPLRTQKDWEHRMGQKHPQVYAIGDPEVAYLWFTPDEFWSDLHIGEMAWTSLEGYKGCMALLKSLSVNMNSVTWIEPPHSPYFSLFWDQGIVAQINRPTMVRIITLDSLLKKLPNKGGDFSMRVVDPILEKNNGTWTCFGDNWTRSESGPADMTINVAQLSQVLIGQYSLEQLATWQLLEVHNADRFQQSIPNFGTCPVVCMEFF